jgi:hypothetical protein
MILPIVVEPYFRIRRISVPLANVGQGAEQNRREHSFTSRHDVIVDASNRTPAASGVDVHRGVMRISHDVDLCCTISRLGMSYIIATAGMNRE